MDKRLLIGGVLAAAAGIMHGVFALAVMPFGPLVVLGRSDAQLAVSAVEAALPWLCFALAVGICKPASPRERGAGAGSAHWRPLLVSCCSPWSVLAAGS